MGERYPVKGWAVVANLVLLAALLLCSQWRAPLIAFRLMRNLFSPKLPPPLPFKFQCSNEDLAGNVTIVITAKDTCSQAPALIAHLRDYYPANVAVVYAAPEFWGCAQVDVDSIGKLFDNFVHIRMNPSASPIRGFLEGQKYVKTPYALLLHSDAFPIEPEAMCELYKTLETHPDQPPFAAPQLMEKSENGIYVPHAHQQYLHLRKGGNMSSGLEIAFDLDFELLTRRYAMDFPEGGTNQSEFLEDHAYLARTSTYHLYIDEFASFTMEYMDNVMSMRTNNTRPIYVPTARFVFDVDVEKVVWKDIPYFVRKRSEEVGLTVRRYLMGKWDISFPDTGIWNYVKASFLMNKDLRDGMLPTDWEGQAVLFWSWFESVGFNRYGDIDFVTLTSSVPPGEVAAALPKGTVRVQRNVDPIPPQPVAPERMPLKPINGTLPISTHARTFAVKLKPDRQPLQVLKSDKCAPDDCHLLVVKEKACECYVYVKPYSTEEAWWSLALRNLADTWKLPSRALAFLSMKYTTNRKFGKDRAGWESVTCRGNETCFIDVSFDEKATLAKWGWR